MNKEMFKYSYKCDKIPILCNEKASTSMLSDSEEDFMIITGVNHKATNRSIYSSLALVGIKKT